MLTQAEIALGEARLVADKLTAADVSGLSSVFAMTFAGLLDGEVSYDWETDLAALTDAGNSDKKAAQVAGSILKLEELGFTGAILSGGRGALTYKESEEYLRIVLFAFSKLYPIPKEFSIFDLRRSGYFRVGRKSQTAMSRRAEVCLDGSSERELRRRSSRRAW